ncbi:VanZ family protein [Tellurirhabdus rosea]|uniref:VanZ family protein n=1 Tax=Tellurirhabdus rosea TaxID=2674997 RepID=UPI002253ECC7|nr:VanZ family protein [Tellurirhabdus rosea]
MFSTKVVRTLAVVWTVIIFIGCAWPGDGSPGGNQNDKVMHFAIFALWAFLWRKASPLTNATLLLIGVAYGLLIEVYQLVMPINRAFEWLDLLADTVGVIGGLLASMVIWPLLVRKS